MFHMAFEQSSFLDVEHINNTSSSDFMKVAVPFILKVYKVGKNSSMNINYFQRQETDSMSRKRYHDEFLGSCGVDGIC